MRSFKIQKPQKQKRKPLDQPNLARAGPCAFRDPPHIGAPAYSMNTRYH